MRDNKPWDNARFDTLSVLSKTVSGNLLTTAQWQFVRSDAYCVPDLDSNCYADVDGNGVRDTGDWAAAGTRTVTETRPDGSQSISVFGTAWNVDEGQLLSTRVLSPAAPTRTELTRTEMSYVQSGEIGPTGHPFPDRVGDSLLWEFQPGRTAFTRPLKLRRTHQQKVDFIWQAVTFDAMARPVTVNRRSETPAVLPLLPTIRDERTETTTWADDASPWVLGLLTEVYSEDLDRTLEYRIYDDLKALPKQIFGEGIRTSPLGAGLLLFQKIDYDAAGRVIWVEDGRGNRTKVEDWYRGVPRTITYADLETRLATVNALGQVTQVTDQAGFATGFAYDARGLVSQVTYPTGDAVAWNATTQGFAKTTAIEYGLPVGTWRQTVSTGNARKVTWFDALWRPVLVREYDNANATGTQRFNATTYDAEGRQTFVAYPRASITALTDFTAGTRTKYDGLGRATSVEIDTELGKRSVRSAYLDGFLTQTTNANDFVTTTAFQAFDSPDMSAPVLIDAPENQRTIIMRDPLGRATEMSRLDTPELTTPVVRQYAFDVHGRLCQTNEPETGATVMQYDAAGNVSWSAAGLGYAPPEDAAACESNRGLAYTSGRRVDRTYDALNRLLTLSFPDGVGNQTWTYTEDGLPKTIRTLNNSSGGEIVDNAYTYNSRRLLTGESSSQPGAYTWSVGYGYDANGSLASLVYPSGLTIAYAPNALGQPTQAGSYATGVQYFPNGAVKQFTYGNDIVHTLQQNLRQLPARSIDGSSVIDLTYYYDSNGNNIHVLDGLDGNRSRWMAYDDLDRLTDAGSAIFGGDHWHHFSYDVQDNLRSWTLAGVKDYARYEYDARNQLTAIFDSADDLVESFAYDPQGNLDKRHPDLPAEQNFSFDFGNRNRGIVGQEGFRYDGHGRRVSTWLPNQLKARFYMYGRSGQLFFEGSETQGINSEFVYLGDDLIAAKELVLGGGGYRVRYKHTDALGSPVATTDESGVVVDRTNYEPFGKTIGENLDGVGYTGHVMDPQSGLVYMQQRYYEPIVGRFLSVDQVSAMNNGDMRHFNRYAYGYNNPYSFKDPDGREGACAYTPGECGMRPLTSAEHDRRDEAYAEAGIALASVAPIGRLIGGSYRIARGIIAARAAASAGRIARALEGIKVPGKALVESMNRVGLSQNEAMAAIQQSLPKGQVMAVESVAGGSRVAYGTGFAQIGGTTTSQAISVGANGTAVSGTATFSTTSQGGKLVHTLIKFEAKPR